MPKILPLLNEHGLVLTQPVTYLLSGSEGTVPALTTRLTHVATGDVLESTAPLMLDKNTAQGLGSAITYMRRYMLLSILGLVADVDDDGAGAEKAAPKARPATTRKATPAKAAPDTSGSDDDW